MSTTAAHDRVRTDVLVVGAGPGGASAATHLARLGRDVLLADGAVFPRDKACGDGLTPRAVAELQNLKLDHVLQGGPVNNGLRGYGFGQSLVLPWNGPHLPKHGSAIARTVLDNALRDAERTVVVEPQHVIVADGGKSHLGRILGRQWHQETVYGVASRAYATSPNADDPWITSHLELRDESGRMMGGYGWVFPLGGGLVNIGAGTLATKKRPANINLKKLTEEYARQRRDEWQLGDLSGYGSAPLPMGGGVSGVSGPNWMLIGDAAACINPLNGEGIDYALETGRLAAEHLVSHGPNADLTASWAAELYAEYGDAFSIARRLGLLITHERLLAMSGPIGMRSHAIMSVAFRVMGNLVIPEDRDLVARTWRLAGRASLAIDRRRPFH